MLACEEKAIDRFEGFKHKTLIGKPYNGFHAHKAIRKML
jgi:hypothetical protein